MFWGRMHCKACDYESPDFMCMPHGDSWAFGVLLQDTDSLALRVFWIAPLQASGRTDFTTEDEANGALEGYLGEVLADELKPNERRVPLQEFFRAEASEPSAVPCPHCRRPLFWQGTGIS